MSGTSPAHSAVPGIEGPPNYPSDSTEQKSSDVNASGSVSPSFVKRAMDTADKLNKSTRSLLSQSQPSLPAISPSRRNIISRGKGKEKATSNDGKRLGVRMCMADIHSVVFDRPVADETTTAQPSNPNSVLRRTSGRLAASLMNDPNDSPFITPRSPPFGPTRSMFNIFRGDGSVGYTIQCQSPILIKLGPFLRCVRVPKL